MANKLEYKILKETETHVYCEAKNGVLFCYPKDIAFVITPSEGKKEFEGK